MKWQRWQTFKIFSPSELFETDSQYWCYKGRKGKILNVLFRQQNINRFYFLNFIGRVVVVVVFFHGNTCANGASTGFYLVYAYCIQYYFSVCFGTQWCIKWKHKISENENREEKRKTHTSWHWKLYSIFTSDRNSSISHWPSSHHLG